MGIAMAADDALIQAMHARELWTVTAATNLL